MVFSLTGNKRLFLYYLAPLSLCRAYCTLPASLILTNCSFCLSLSLILKESDAFTP